MPIIKKPFSLAPLNDNPVVLTASGDDLVLSGGFSHKQGFPTMKWSIPPQPAMLEMSSLRLVGQLLVKKADNKILVARNNGADYSNGQNHNTQGKGGLIEENGADMISQTAINLANWGGVQNCIDKVVVQSKKSLIELTSVNNYGQYVGLAEAYSNNGDDYLVKPNIQSLSCGTHADKQNRRMITAATSTAGNAPSLKDGANDRMIGQFFSVPIKIDLMGDENLFLDDDYLGGLLLTIHLASDSGVFCNKYSRAGANVSAVNDMSALNYVLKSVRLEGRYIVPDQNDIAAIPPVMSLDSRLNLINDIHSSVNANAFTPQLQAVKSISSVFLDSDQTNTFTKNQNNFRYPVGMKSYQQARNGLRYPYNYETFAKPNFESITETGLGTHSESALQFPALVMGDCEVRKQFEASLMNGGKPYHSSANLGTTNAALTQDADDSAVGATDLKNKNTIVDCVGIGVDYTLGLGMTQQFVNQDYNLTLRSGVNTGNALLTDNRNGKTNANPLLQQSFLRYNSQFNTQSLIKII